MECNVTINTDDNYLQHTMAMLCSLFENNKGHNIIVHVMQKELSENSRANIRNLAEHYNQTAVFYNVDESKLEGVQFRKNRPLSKAAYYRLLLSSTLPSNIDKILYLDCDMIILRDISEIFRLDIGCYALAACIDRFPYDNQHRLQLQMEADERTFCSGIMLVNLKYWRVESGLLEYAKQHRKVVYLHDQDVLNYFFKKRWFLLPPKWNRRAYAIYPPYYKIFKKFDLKEYIYEPMLFHYAALDFKPWHKSILPNSRPYRRYLILSNYENIILERRSLIQNLKSLKLTICYYFSKYITSKIILFLYKN